MNYSRNKLKVFICTLFSFVYLESLAFLVSDSRGMDIKIEIEVPRIEQIHKRLQKLQDVGKHAEIGLEICKEFESNTDDRAKLWDNICKRANNHLVLHGHYGEQFANKYHIDEKQSLSVFRLRNQNIQLLKAYSQRCNLFLDKTQRIMNLLFQSGRVNFMVNPVLEGNDIILYANFNKHELDFLEDLSGITGIIDNSKISEESKRFSSYVKVVLGVDNTVRDLVGENERFIRLDSPQFIMRSVYPFGVYDLKKQDQIPFLMPDSVRPELRMMQVQCAQFVTIRQDQQIQVVPEIQEKEVQAVQLTQDQGVQTEPLLMDKEIQVIPEVRNIEAQTEPQLLNKEARVKFSPLHKLGNFIKKNIILIGFECFWIPAYFIFRK